MSNINYMEDVSLFCEFLSCDWIQRRYYLIHQDEYKWGNGIQDISKFNSKIYRNDDSNERFIPENVIIQAADNVEILDLNDYNIQFEQIRLPNLKILVNMNAVSNKRPFILAQSPWFQNLRGLFVVTPFDIIDDEIHMTREMLPPKLRSIILVQCTFANYDFLLDPQIENVYIKLPLNAHEHNTNLVSTLRRMTHVRRFGYLREPLLMANHGGSDDKEEQKKLYKN
nr:hypothetical protein [Microctonus hyperodae filamentous virus]